MKSKKIFRNKNFICMIVLSIVILCQGWLLIGNTQKKFQTDYEYKMFYGKWKVTEFMGVGKYFRGEKQSNYIGNIIYYDNSIVQINDVTVLKKPIYQFGIIPNDKHEVYTQRYPAKESDILWGVFCKTFL